MFCVEDGTIYKEFEAQAELIELLCGYENIHLFSFNHRFDIITDLNNYCDGIHYAHWINSLILQWMHDGKYEITSDNYKQLLEEELEFFLSFDYNSLNHQVDYEDDLFAAALINQELTGVRPIVFSADEILHEAVFPVSDSKGYRYLVFSAKKESGSGNPNVLALDALGQPAVAFEAESDDPGDTEWHQYTMSLGREHDISTVTLNSAENADYLFRDIYLY